MRRLQLAVGFALFMDATLYLAVLPLLPYYAERFHLSKLTAGLILAAYPLLVLLASAPAGALTGKIGGRTLTIGGNAAFSLATVAFAVAPNGLVLAAARGVQGIASAITWTAAMAWLTANAPADGRGAAVGRAMSMLSAGAIVGPGIGALGGALSPRTAFLLAAGVGVAATLAAIACPAGVALPHEPGIARTIRRAGGHPLILAAAVLGAVDSICAAVVDLLTPLELGRRGFSATAIGVAFTAGAVLGILASARVGRLVDRLGALRVGTAAAIGMALVTQTLAVPLPSIAIFALLVALGPLFTSLVTALFPLAAEGADALGLSHGAANGIVNLGWAGGFAVGPVAGGALAQAVGDAAGYTTSAIVALTLLALVHRAGKRRLALVGGECQEAA